MKRLQIAVVILSMAIAVPGYALNPAWAKTFKNNLWTIVDRHPAYYWGGYDNEKQGLDCSGYIFLAMKRSGVPVKRVSAFEMKHGLGGWSGKDIPLDDAEELDIPFWDLQKSRPFGHVGAFIVGRDTGLLEVTHSGSSTGVTHHKLYGPFIRDMSAVRHLTIGDKTK